jgi:hypothetical protein
MRDSERVILLCEVCGERTVLGRPLAVWRSASTTFECECGERLTLADRLDSGESNQVAATAAAKPPTSLFYR